MARMMCLGRDVAAFQPTDRDSVAYRRDTVRPAFDRIKPVLALEAQAKRHETTLGQTVLPNGGSILLRGGRSGERVGVGGGLLEGQLCGFATEWQRLGEWDCSQRVLRGGSWGI